LDVSDGITFELLKDLREKQPPVKVEQFVFVFERENFV